MKKSTFLATALASLFLAASCQQENLESVAQDTAVKFQVEVPGGMDTKAIADASEINVVHYEIYKVEHADTDDADYTYSTGVALAKGHVEVSNKTADVTFDLLVDQKYVAIFWAQQTDDPATGANAYYEIGDLREISLKDPVKTTGNAESRAAFFRTYMFSTETVQDHKVTLYRPFAQLNLGTTQESLEPEQTGEESGHSIVLDESQVLVTGLATKFNTLAGIENLTVENNDDVHCGEAVLTSTTTYAFDFESADVPSKNSENEFLQVTDKNGVTTDYKYVAMNYFFATNNVTVEYNIVTDKGTVNNTVTNVPVGENFRTNIIGNLLTSKTDFEIVIDERFNVPDENIYYDENDNVAPCDYQVDGKTYKVYTAVGLLKYAYMVNYVDKTLELELRDNIALPQYEIAVDHTNQTYVYTTTPVTVDNDGIPSGNNWVAIGDYDTSDWFYGKINGKGHTISGLRMVSTTPLAGFIGYAECGGTVVENLNLTDAVVYNTAKYTCALVAWMGDGVVVKNCHLTNVHVLGRDSYTGGITGYDITRGRADDETCVIENCSVDATSTVTGVNYVGGISGNNYGSIMKKCYNAATVTGANCVGGLAGESRDYHHYKDGWMIACHNEGTIIATSSAVGGIMGQSLEGSGHKDSESYMVACWSTAPTADYQNVLVGSCARAESHYGSWGLKTKSSQTPLPAGTYTSCYAFDSAASITQDDIDAMNRAIDEYNTGREQEDPTYCPYKWTWTEGSLPVLQ